MLPSTRSDFSDLLFAAGAKHAQFAERGRRANDGARRLDKAFRLDNGAGRLPARPDQPVDGTATGGGKKQPGATGRATCASQCGSWRRSVLVACVGCRLPLSLVRVCHHIVGAVHNRGLVTERTRVPPTYGPAAKQRDETSLGHVQGGGSRQDGNPDQCARSRARSKTRGVRPNGCKSSAIET